MVDSYHFQVRGGRHIHGARSLPVPSPATEVATHDLCLQLYPAYRENTSLSPWKTCLGLVNMPSVGRIRPAGVNNTSQDTSLERLG